MELNFLLESTEFCRFTLSAVLGIDRKKVAVIFVGTESVGM